MAILSYTKADGTVVKLNSYKVNNLIPQQSKGDNPNAVMSQKAVTDELNSVGLQIDEVTGTISTLSQTVNTKANSADVYTKGEADGKFLTAADITGKADKSEVSAVKAIADKNTADIADINTDITEINNTLGECATSDALGELENIVSLKANKSEVYSKGEADGKFLTEHQDISGKANAADLSAEVSRATAAEGELTTSISDEVTRATTAEGELDTRVTTLENTTSIDCGTY